MMLARMKQRSNHNNVYYYSDDSDIEEYEVAEILCQLPQLILRSEELRYLLNLTWGSKKKRRTAISASPSPSSASPLPTHQPPPLPVLTCENGEEEEQEEEEEEEEQISKVKKDTSPDTPLSFYPHSESDSKKKPHKRKVSKKKTKEELEEALIKISDQNDTFKKAVEKVMEHYETLMAENLRIKSKMQELNNCRQREGLLDLNSSETGTSLDLLVEPAGPTVPSPAPEQPVELVSMMGYEQPPLVDQKPFGSEIFENSGYPYVQMPTSLPAGIGLTMAQRLGSLGIPDLNFTADHETTAATVPATTRTRMRFFQPFDLRKAVLTAEARRRRIEMTKVKKSMANAKTRLQIR